MSTNSRVDSRLERTHADLMDRIYRWQKPIYDMTRRYYLIGRDRLLDEIEIEPGHRVIEIGCGTGRNLIKLAERHPDVLFYGLDASSEMLDVASRKIASAGMADRIALVKGYAEQLDYLAFGLEEPFDVAFFSYSLTMIPSCIEAFDAAVANLSKAGSIHVVDFCDGAGLPPPLGALLRAWLSLFHVSHKPEMLERLESLRSCGDVEFKPVWGRYAYIARFSPSSVRFAF